MSVTSLSLTVFCAQAAEVSGAHDGRITGGLCAYNLSQPTASCMLPTKDDVCRHLYSSDRVANVVHAGIVVYAGVVYSVSHDGHVRAWAADNLHLKGQVGLSPVGCSIPPSR